MGFGIIEVGEMLISSHFVDNNVDNFWIFPRNIIKRLWILWISFWMGVDRF